MYSKRKEKWTNKLENLADQKSDILRDIEDLTMCEKIYSEDLKEIVSEEKNCVDRKQT